MREEPEEPNSFPLAARGLILDRQMYGAHIKPPPAVAGPAFDAAVQEWLEGKARYLLFVQRRDGRAIILETSNLGTVRKTYNQRLLEFEARRLVCLIDPVIGDPLRSELDQRGERHALEMSILFEQGEKPREGLKVIKGAIAGLGDVVVLSADRGIIETGQVYGLLRELDRLVKSPEELARHWQRVFVTFDGYDDDPREVFEIPEVRAYIGKLTEAAPWWLGLIGQTDQFAWLASIAELAHVHRAGSRRFRAEFKPQALEQAVSTAFTQLGPLLICARFENQALVGALIKEVSASLKMLLAGQNQRRASKLH